MLEVEEDLKISDEELKEIIQKRLIYGNDSSYRSAYDPSNDEKLEERPITRPVPLEDHLLQQLRIEITDPLELKIGELIIGQLDQDGYFRTSIEEIAHLANLHETEIVLKVLKMIQNFELCSFWLRRPP